MSWDFDPILHEEMVKNMRISDVVSAIKEKRSITVPMLQRYLYISYSEACNLIKTLEEEGILWKQENIMLPRKINRDIVNSQY